MKSKKRKLKKSVIYGFILIIIIVIIALILMVNKDKKNTQNNTDIIVNNYNLLSDNVKQYNEIREKFMKETSGVFIDDYIDEQEDFEDLLHEYSSVMTDIDKYIEKIDSKCKEKYNSKEAGKICNNYKVTYEKLVNLYINDINSYNDIITKYNEYRNKSLELFNGIYKDYLDYNNDGKFEGRDSSEKSK